MRGSPLFRALLMLVALVLVAWPVWRITHAGTSQPVANPTTAVPGPTVPTKPQLSLDFLPIAPVDFDVKYLGKSIWRGGGGITASSPPLDFAIPTEGVDLQLTAHWSGDLRNGAVRVRLSAPGGGPIERLAWTRDSAALDEVLTFVDR